MKLPKLLVRKKLRVSATRRSLGEPEMDYEEMAEPNMKLSRALLIVLVLHVVAVSGIIAFNTIKSRQGAFPPPTSSATAAPAQTVANTNAKEEPAFAMQPISNATNKSAAKEETKIPRALPVGNDSGNSYVVAKGDNPVKIAKKLKVSESELLELNHIDDPRKLQIGQKLLVPPKAGKKK